MQRAVLAIAVLIASLVAPATASAAEAFAGLLANGALVRFQSDRPVALTRPVRVTGVRPRERLVALGSDRRTLWAIGASARLYRVNPYTGAAAPVGPPFTTGLRGIRFSLAVTPDGTQARLLSDVGQNLAIDLARGTVAELPMLRRSDENNPAFPAADFTADGKLVGVDLVRREILTETAPGANVLSPRALSTIRGTPFSEPVAFDLPGGTQGWALASFGGRNRDRQSLLMPIALDSGHDLGAFRPFLRQVVAFASIGQVADDQRGPALRISGPRRVSVAQLLNGRMPLRVSASEGAQIGVWLRFGNRSRGYGLSIRDFAVQHRFRDFRVFVSDRRAVLRHVGRTATITFDADDYAGNRVSVSRTVRLVR